MLLNCLLLGFKLPLQTLLQISKLMKNLFSMKPQDTKDICTGNRHPKYFKDPLKALHLAMIFLTFWVFLLALSNKEPLLHSGSTCQPSYQEDSSFI